jgi:protein SCO1/2
MKLRGPSCYAFFAALALVVTWVGAHGADPPAERLATIGPATDFTLTAEDGAPFSTAELRGKVVALNFVFTRCADVCPIATAKMVQIQRALGETFGRDVFFVSVTIDPEHDTSEVLARYARALGYDPSGWAFLTGAPAVVRDVARSYGVLHDRRSGGEVDHNLLTSLVDREGMLRVQYMGERFDPRELLHDLRDLMAEGRSP